MSTCDANIQTEKGNELYALAAQGIGRDVSPRDLAPDDVACAESVSMLIQKIYPGFPTILSTAQLHTFFLNHTENFRKVDISNCLPGDIIVSPTGMGNNPRMPHGHTGILAKEGICSNDSASGEWHEYYTLQTWINRYQKVGGYPVFIFRPL